MTGCGPSANVSAMISTILWIAAAYLLGSIPFGLLLARGAGIDLRSVGSGNIGATNVLRTGNKWLAAATLLLDAGKGFAAVWLTFQFGLEAWLPTAAALAAFLGHLFPVWLRFRGGKGVATMLGITFAFWWPLGVAAIAVWLLGAAVTRYSSVGGMLAALVLPAGVTWNVVTNSLWWWMGNATVLVLVVFWSMAALLIWKHRDNIARLRAGTESQIGQKS